jgi:crossover junction endodeoxyribonuclease RusA
LTVNRSKYKAVYHHRPLINTSSNGSTEGVLNLTLPLPPSINHQYATVQGRRVLSSAGRRFKLQIGHEVLCAIAARRHGRSFMHTLNGQSLVLDLRFYFESGLRRDIDGGLKITQDAVCEALGINDNRIVEVILRKDTDRAAPRMELSLRIAQT